MKVRFWGVRGSIPAPGPDTNRYGGNTSCVSVAADGARPIVLDMGTGLMHLGVSLMATEFGRGQGRAAVLLSHAHWDHIQGFPFFPPVFVDGNAFSIYGAGRSPSMLEGILEGQMNPHFSPIYTLKNLGAHIELHAVEPGVPFDIDGVRVIAQSNPHGSTTALAFRLECGGRSLVYAPDVGYPAGGPSEAVLALYRGADLLIHDCTYTPEDRAERLDRGFSSYEDAAGAAIRAGARHLVMFHYDQDYADDDVDALRDRCRAWLDAHGGRDIALTAAAEGLELDV
ncbi:MAG: MBL fold metallo-hydrolase [Deltaproteobacteria bacterium]|nr:MAG: MBL fold metallo-hydrolase [Deltaproteobacteria bacterium]